MAPAIPVVSSESSKSPDQIHGALTLPEHRSSAPPHEQVNASWKSSETCPLNHISEPKTVNLPLNEPLTFRMREEIRTQLRLSWHENRESEYCHYSKWAWTSYAETNRMLSIGSSPKSRDAVMSSGLRTFYNKPTTLYWAHSAQNRDECPRFIWGCIYKEWVRYHDYKPKMDFEHFFANPIQITSTGPSTVFDILGTHEYLYNQASLLLDKIKRAQLEESRISARPSPKIFKLSPICRAIIMVFDEIVGAYRPERCLEIDAELQRQNVLMVRTGDESGLSEPISFEGVRHTALPLARPDLNAHDGIEAIRVTLATAVRFVADLQRREELAFPKSAPSPAIDRRLYPMPHPKMSPATTTNVDAWVDKLMEMADGEGVDNVREVQKAVSAVKAMHRGESSPYDFWPIFVRWR